MIPDQDEQFLLSNDVAVQYKEYVRLSNGEISDLSISLEPY